MSTIILTHLMECGCGRDLVVSRDQPPDHCDDCGKVCCEECRHACAHCAHIGCESCLVKEDAGWFCGIECRIAFREGVLKGIRQDAQEQCDELGREIEQLRKAG